MTETNAERLERIKRTARHDELATRTGPKPVVLLDPADYDFLVEQARQTIDTQIQFVELHRDWLNLRTENERLCEASAGVTNGQSQT
ncbi:hypothetical protein QT711_11345 [Sporosarcina saromensis]|uniref:Antitoxin Phd_YefM, type II toxin-antitoxin system n=1 Tax=Sporosarcina saromensis TaxID=359365 RepID=A0ABU4GBU3_9BACL|nr:hypothetical protein [Sporosarcina saromensis]MDW0113783.1 hypothetical protein [Sporosarcina saromensis]